MKKIQRSILFGITIILLCGCYNPFLYKEGKQKKSIVNAVMPLIITHPQSAVYVKDGVAALLTVNAVSNDEGTLSYQWYRNVTDNNEGGTEIDAANTNNYLPPTNIIGTVYYYAAVTNTIYDNNDGGLKFATTVSTTAKIEVNAVGNNEPILYTVIINISGSEDNDFITFNEHNHDIHEITGKDADEITLYYNVDNVKRYNELRFEGINGSITPVYTEHDRDEGSRTYIINSADASADRKIIIMAVFNHSNTELVNIAFENINSNITVTYGDNSNIFTNTIDSMKLSVDNTVLPLDSALISYSIHDENNNPTSVAVINSSTGVVTILKTGTVLITAEKAEDAAFSHASASYALTINQKPISISGLSAADRVYDGTTAVTLSGGSLIGIAGGDTVTITHNVGSMADKNIGTGKAVTTNIQLSGADAGNYTLTQPGGITVNITAKALTISNVTAANRVYDGTTAVTLSGGQLQGVVDGDTVGFTSGSGTAANANAGDSKAITTSITLTGADMGNYTLTQPTVTVNITKAPGANVGTPAVSGTPTANSISVNQLTAPVNGQVIEYARSTINNANAATLAWQAGITFNGLAQGTTYYVYARAKENTNYNAGTYSVSAGIATAVDAGFDITLDQIINDEAPPLIHETPISRSEDGETILTLDNPAAYESINWYISGTGIEYLNDIAGKLIFYETDFHYYANGIYFITLEVKKDGMWYSTTIEFELAD